MTNPPYLTQSDAVRDYVESDGYRCHHCQEKRLLRGLLIQDERGVTQVVTCLNCRKQWRDVYALIDVDDS